MSNFFLTWENKEGVLAQVRIQIRFWKDFTFDQMYSFENHKETWISLINDGESTANGRSALFG